MAKLTFTGNLTKDAQMKENNGRKYLLLNVAENIRKKEENGDYRARMHKGTDCPIEILRKAVMIIIQHPHVRRIQSYN